MAHSPFEHVFDQKAEWPVFERLFGGWTIPLPTIHLPLLNYDFHVTKFMVLELIVAVAMLAIFIPLCRRASTGELPRGPWWNAFESLLTFIRDQVARPNIGEHDADRYVPFLWTMFIFILFCNLMGLIPIMGSPTASIWMTAGLALCSFVVLHGSAIAKMGFGHYVKSLWPHMDVPYIGFPIALMIFCIEVFGTFIKSCVLAIRLFANMFAGHTVLAMILLFIVLVGEHGFSAIWPVVTFSSVFGVVALSFLELFVAFLQAYVFVFLTALFMGMAMHPQH